MSVGLIIWSVIAWMVSVFILMLMSSSLSNISKSLQILTKERSLPLIKKYEGEIETWKDTMKYADENMKKHCQNEIKKIEFILNKLRENKNDKDNTYND